MPKIRCSYQLHIQLNDSKPAIWRRLVVADTTSLAQLHRTIQAAMGWSNLHGYAFEIAGQRYGLPNADLPEDPTMDARRYSLGQLLQGEALAVRYLYDLSAGWQLRIKLEACTPVGSPEALLSLPICLGGRNACPPENTGGMQTFNDAVLALQDPQHADHPAARRLLPAAFDAKQFDLQSAQDRIHALELARPSTAAAPKPETAFA